MPLLSGLRLGPYEILAPLGAGGMGEIYRARDTRLDRTVAIKVLSIELAKDAQFRARFDREARAISQLSHPHICTLYDVGDADGTAFLVMELLQGQTLAERIRKGALPLDEALKIAVEIADALSAAHRLGIVHRDLKPGNIMLTKTGAKLLDFGLAKAAEPAVAIGTGGDSLTASTHLTGKGSILGTLHYMAPEQVEGREADTRSDIWALGAVVYEMVTGQQVFAGESAAGIVGAILKDRPLPLSTRHREVPPALDHLVARCLERDVDERWQSASDVKRELSWIAAAPGHTSPVSVTPSTPSARLTALLPWAISIAAVVGAGYVWLMRPSAAAPMRDQAKTVLAIPPTPAVRMLGASALSPDGRSFVYVGLGAEGAPTLWLYSLDSGETHQLGGTEGASFPFWSPKGDAVGFFDGRHLKTATFGGAPPRTISSVGNARGGAWTSDGTILFSPSSNGPLMRVSEKGGEPTVVLSIDAAKGEVGRRWPTIVDTRHFLFVLQSAHADLTGIYLATTDPPSAVRLTGAYSSTAMVDGRVLYVDSGMIVARTLDVEHGRFKDEPETVAGPVASLLTGLGYAAFSVSSTGALAFPQSDGHPGQVFLRWIDRQSRLLGRVGLPGAASYGQAISPDGGKVVFNSFPVPTGDLYVLDIARDATSRFTTDGANDQYPVWSPDGTQVLFTSNRTGFYNLYLKPVSGIAGERIFAKTSSNQYANDWSRDGKTIIYTNEGPSTQGDIWTRLADGSGEPVPFLMTPANETSAKLSLDGRWLAYASDETGTSEVFVQRFPEGGDKVQVSTSGGSEPQWRADGLELYYVTSNWRLAAVPITRGATLTVGRASTLFETYVDTSLGRLGQGHYAPSGDGQRFLVNVLPDVPPTVVLMQHWADAKPDAAKR